MRIGVSIAQAGRLASTAAVRSAATAAEVVGYSSVWVCDAEPGDLPVLDPIAVLLVAAGVTGRVRLGTSVLVAPWYRPDVLARSLATLDEVSERRLTVGLGVGDGPGAGRGAHLEAVLDALDRPWPGTVRPPVLLGGRSPGALDRVARRADGWNPRGVPVAELGATWASVRDLAAGHGREPDRLSLVVRADVELTDRALGDGRASYAGSVEQVADDLLATAGVGATEVILGVVGDPTLDEALDRYARVAEALESVPAG